MEKTIDEIRVKIITSGKSCGDACFVTERVEREVVVNGTVVHSDNINIDTYRSQNDTIKTFTDRFLLKKRESPVNISIGCLVKNLVVVTSDENPERISEIVMENLARVVSDAGVDHKE